MSSPSEQTVHDIDEIFAELRALAMIRKYPVRLCELLDDFTDLEGYVIDPREYGFSCAEEMLAISGEFILTYQKEELFVAARPKANTAHITKMIKRQKHDRTRRRDKFYDRSRLVPTNSLSDSSSKTSPPKRRRTPPPPPLFSRPSDNDEFLRSMANNNRIFINPVNRDFQPQMPDIVPDSTYMSFIRSFSEPILNYRDVEAAIGLEVYCSLLGMNPPCYEVYQLNSFRGFLCTVFIAELRFSTEPDAYDTPLRAKIECAAIAKQRIFAQTLLTAYPLANYRNRTLARRLYNELVKYPGGISFKSIPAMFQYAYSQALPDHWPSIVRSSSKFLLKVNQLGELIASANPRPY